MKRKTIISLIVCFTTLVSCNHTEDVMPENNRVTIRATQEMSTRVAFDGRSSTWVNGDKLNVIVENLNDVYEFTYDASSENHFVCDNLTLPATENNIYAFYGVDKSSVNITGKSTSTQLASSSQTQDIIQSPTSHIAEYDILYGRALNAVGDNIDIPMSHSIAVIKVNINNALTEAKSVKRVIITAPDNVALS